MAKNIWKMTTGKIITLGVIAGGLIAGGGIAIYSLLKTEETSDLIEYKYKELKILNSLKLKEANIENTDEFWLDETGLQMLRDKIERDLDYGPEIFKLREIVIGDSNNIDNGSNGVFYPGLDKIYINTYNFKEKLDKYSSFFVGKENELRQLKVNLLYGIMFHEYGHHIANTYLNEYDTKKRDVDIYENGKHSYWNKDFIDKFETLLNYKDWKGKKYKDEGINGPDSNSTFKSIGSIYSQQDLFQLSNFNNQDNFEKLDQNSNFQYIFAGKYSKIFPQMDKKTIKYNFSMDELFTRKYQQLNQVYNPVFSGDENNEQGFLLDSHPLFSRNYIIVISSLLNDAIFYQQGLGNVVKNASNKFNLQKMNTNPNWNDWIQKPSTSNRYLYDSPFGNSDYQIKDEHGSSLTQPKNTAESLYSLMDNFLGHADSSEISILWSKNSLDTKSAKIGLDIREEDYENYENLFKFGGYIPTDDYVSVGYMNNGKYEKLSDIEVHPFKYMRKEWLGAKVKKALDPNKSNYFYATKNFINKNDLLQSGLYFMKKDGKSHLIKTVRDYARLNTNDEKTGSANSFQPSLQNLMNKKYPNKPENVYAFEESNGQARFTQKGTIKWA